MDAYTKGDAAGSANVFAQDVVYIAATGKKLTGRKEMEQYFANSIKSVGELKSYEAKADEAHGLPDGSVLALGHSHGEGASRSFAIHWMALYAPDERNELKVKMISLGTETPPGSQAQAPSSR